ILSNVNQRGLALSPFVVNFAANSTTAKIDVTLTEPAPVGGQDVTLASDNTDVATVPAGVTIPAGRNTASFNITRVGPGVASITARATVIGASLESKVVVTTAQPAPKPAGGSPATAPAGAKITISRAGFIPVPHSNIVSFVRNGARIAVIDPTKNEIVFDATNLPSLRVEVPDVAPGPVQIVVATIDGPTGVISDPSAPINFIIGRPDLNPPTLTSVSPAQGKPRDQIAINDRQIGSG